MSDAVFFDGFGSLVRILIVAPLAYAGLVLLLRISGKRTLTKLNAFDLVITVALGSTLATQVLSADVALFEGLLAFALLIGLQWLVTYTSVRSKTFRHLVRSEPTILFCDGAWQAQALRRERVTESEVQQAVRASGLRDVQDAKIVYLQTDGGISAIAKPDRAGT